MKLTPAHFCGMRLLADPRMTEPVEDWSEVRSPSRAARRRRQGHLQRIRYVERPKPEVYRIGDCLVAHPDTIAKLLALAAETPAQRR